MSLDVERNATSGGRTRLNARMKTSTSGAPSQLRSRSRLPMCLDWQEHRNTSDLHSVVQGGATLVLLGRACLDSMIACSTCLYHDGICEMILVPYCGL
jgi:hypothetical protein